MSDEQARRVGLNEALFRQVNEQIRGLTRSFGADDGTMTVICECAMPDCTDQLVVGVEDYERVRSDARCYMIAAGHEIPELEEVLEEHDGWGVVRKREGIPAEVSEETNPRS